MSWTKLFSKPNKPTTTEVGKVTESLAGDYLTAQGLTFLEANFHCRGGEIDLIMKELDTFVFVEVKYRKSNQYGGAINAVSASKQKKFKHCVTFYLQQCGLNEYNTPCRVDVVTIEGNLHQPTITWLKNAF